MSIKKLGLTIKITERSKLLAALITGALAVFVAAELGTFLQAEVVHGKLQLLWSALCVVGVAVLELFSFTWSGKTGIRVHKRLTAALFFLLPVATLCMMEFLHGTFIYNWSPVVFLQNYGFMLIFYFFCFSLCGRVHFAVALANLVSYVFGMANHYVSAFRGTPLVPADILSADTGLSVVGGFDFFVDNQIVLSSALFVLLLVVAWRMRVEKTGKIFVRGVRIAGLLAAGLFCGTLYKTDWFAEHGMKPDFFNQSRGYTNRGSMFQFVINTKYLTVKQPSDYSAEEAGDIVEDMIADDEHSASGSGKLPNVICIMNETLSDLSVVGEFETNEDYMPFLRSLTENCVKGCVHVPVYGAGTANSEFEFLTGNSMSFLPVGSCAYESYVRDQQPSLVSTMNMLGYATTAFHPYYGENWSRDDVYQYMGFRNYADISTILGEDIVSEYRADKNFSKYYQAVQERFPDQKVFLRRYVCDAFDYAKVIEMQEENRADGDKPFFMFNVTMQNHSGYSYTYSNFDQQIYLTGALEGKYPKTDQYLSLVKEADDALRDLIEYYSTVDEPTILCVFGDHQPSIETEFYEEIYGKSLSELTMEDEQKMYITPFFIWANYDIEEKTVDNISLNYLSALLMDVADLPKTPYQRYLSELSETLPIITTVGYMDSDGNWYRVDDKTSPYAALVEDYRKVQYNNLLDRENRQDRLYLLGSAARR